MIKISNNSIVKLTLICTANFCTHTTTPVSLRTFPHIPGIRLSVGSSKSLIKCIYDGQTVYTKEESFTINCELIMLLYNFYKIFFICNQEACEESQLISNSKETFIINSIHIPNHPLCNNFITPFSQPNLVFAIIDGNLWALIFKLSEVQIIFMTMLSTSAEDCQITLKMLYNRAEEARKAYFEQHINPI